MSEIFILALVTLAAGLIWGAVQLVRVRKSKRKGSTSAFSQRRHDTR